jgi:hypothetical protein
VISLQKQAIGILIILPTQKIKTQPLMHQSKKIEAQANKKSAVNMKYNIHLDIYVNISMMAIK